MPHAAFFERFGYFVERHFFDLDTCLRLRDHMRQAAMSPGVVRQHGAVYTVDEHVRKVQTAQPSALCQTLVEARLSTLMPLLAQHFQVDLTGYAQPQFLVYRPGDFYLPHRDNPLDADAPASATRRKISVSIFLNHAGQPAQPDTYDGGTLTLYGLIDHPRLANCGYPVDSETGLLIAFPSHILHEVTPVTTGKRYSVVTWFY